MDISNEFLGEFLNRFLNRFLNEFLKEFQYGFSYEFLYFPGRPLNRIKPESNRISIRIPLRIPKGFVEFQWNSLVNSYMISLLNSIGIPAARIYHSQRIFICRL
jgi:hypothetical protein